MTCKRSKPGSSVPAHILPKMPPKGTAEVPEVALDDVIAAEAAARAAGTDVPVLSSFVLITAQPVATGNVASTAQTKT